MIPTIIVTILKWLSSDVLSSVLKGLKDRADTVTERKRIQAVQDQHAMTTQANVITSGMSHKAFWVPWLIATVPLSAWFGYGMLDTLFNGALPDTAEIPPGLKEWATIAWGNVFYAGGGVAGATSIAQAVGMVLRK